MPVWVIIFGITCFFIFIPFTLPALVVAIYGGGIFIGLAIIVGILSLVMPKQIAANIVVGSLIAGGLYVLYRLALLMHLDFLFMELLTFPITIAKILLHI
jgi:hypothetical protein